jgi:hypothetical protein
MRDDRLIVSVTERAYVEALQRAPWVVDALAALAKGKRPVS